MIFKFNFRLIVYILYNFLTHNELNSLDVSLNFSYFNIQVIQDFSQHDLKKRVLSMLEFPMKITIFKHAATLNVQFSTYYYSEDLP